MVSRLVLCLALGFPASGFGAGVVLVLGDSLAAGYGLPLGEGWVSLLAERLARGKPDYKVVNASISGETTLGGRNRVGALLDQHKPAVVIVELGANDGLRGASPESIRENLGAIVKASTARKARVLVVGMRMPPNYGTAYTKRFEAVFTEVAREHRTALVPFLFEGFGERREYFQPDGIHPAREAQPLMLETVWKALTPLLAR